VTQRINQTHPASIFQAHVRAKSENAVEICDENKMIENVEGTVIPYAQQQALHPCWRPTLAKDNTNSKAVGGITNVVENVNLSRGNQLVEGKGETCAGAAEVWLIQQKCAQTVISECTASQLGC
jgi:hypothetical protein